MDTAADRIAYPRIPFSDGERQREEDLKGLAKTFQKQMDRDGNPCALKGGTALRFKMGLPRPSTDLDFEGDRAIKTRTSVKEAVNKTFPNGQFSVGWDWFRRGTMSIKPRGLPNPDGRRMGFDYRQCGSQPGMTERVAVDKCERLDGILIYKDKELVNKKLQTVVGPKPRHKARDIYDTGWIVTHHRNLISDEAARKLVQWMRATSPTEAEEFKNRMRDDNVIGRTNADEVWQKLRQGIWRLGVERQLQAPTRPHRMPAHGSSKQDSKLPNQPIAKTGDPTSGETGQTVNPPRPPRPASEPDSPSGHEPSRGPRY